jgi:hypothetical protein
MDRKNQGFLGTYFSRDVVVRIASVARILSWVVVAIYALQWLFQAMSMALQILRGFWQGMGFTDYANSVIFLFEQPLRGIVYFVVLQGVAQALLMFMDIEENTRRAAREGDGKRRVSP